MAYQIRAWALPILIAAYAALALAISPGTYGAMLKSYFTQAFILPLYLCLCLPVAALLLRPRRPLSLIREVLGSGASRLVPTLVLFCFGISAFTTLKLEIPAVVPFYADAFFADLDAWLHGGNPGEIVHSLLPQWAQYPLGYLYGPVWFGLWFSLLAFVSLQNDRALRLRYFWSMALAICLLGTVAATLLSSVGPVFYDELVGGDRFAALMQSIERSAVGDYMEKASGYLLLSYQEDAASMGTGISAMPSIHLAIVTLNAWMLGRLNVVLGVLAWIYVALIQLGSVFLGWHYAIDGYFSIAAVSIIWWAVGRVMAGKFEVAPAPAISAGATQPAQA